MVSSVATIQTQAFEQCHYETASKLPLTFSSSNAVLEYRLLFVLLLLVGCTSECMCLFLRLWGDLFRAIIQPCTQALLSTLPPMITLLPPVLWCCNDPLHFNRNNSHSLSCSRQRESSLQDVSHIHLFHSCNFPSLLSVFPL